MNALTSFSFHVEKRITGALVLYLSNCVLGAICVAFTVSSWNVLYSEQWSFLPSVLSFIAIAINLVYIIALKTKIYDFRLFFLVFTYLYMFGRVWLNFFNLDYDIFWVLHKYFQGIEMQRAALYCISSIQLMFLGVFPYKWRKAKRETAISTTSPESDKKRLLFISTILLVIAVPCRIYTDIYAVISTRVSQSYLTLETPTGLLDDFAYLIIPGLLALFEARPRKRILILPVGAYFAAIMILTGDRRFYVTALVALLFYYVFALFRERKKGVWKRLIILLVLSLFFLNFLEVIMKIRQSGLSSISSFFGEHGLDLFRLDDVIYDVISEFGISFFSVVVTIQNVPGIISFQHGLTFLFTIPSVLPLGSALSDLFASAVPSGVITEATYPVGSAIFGDFYANFGIWGLACSFILGYFLYFCFKAERLGKNAFRTVLYYSHFFVLICLARCSFFEVFRPFVWCTVIPLILYKLPSGSAGKNHIEGLTWNG